MVLTFAEMAECQKPIYKVEVMSSDKPMRVYALLPQKFTLSFWCCDRSTICSKKN
ncbi:hypothetical protein [Nostoc sp.]|uniref:hypothetical protein n=1 Tax=Nostoc sp. TaxID=1180 RepID=UPI002FFB38D3